MDQNKNQGQRQGDQQSGQQHTQQQQPRTQNPNRPSTPLGTGEPAEGSRHQDDNRGMDRELDEQSELPERGSSQTDRESER